MTRVETLFCTRSKMNSWTVVAYWLYKILTFSNGKFCVVNSTTLNPHSETKNLTESLSRFCNMSVDTVFFFYFFLGNQINNFDYIESTTLKNTLPVSGTLPVTKRIPRVYCANFCIQRKQCQMFFHENVGMHCLLYDSLIWNETPTKVSNGFRAYRLLNDGKYTTLYKYYYICLFLQI